MIDIKSNRILDGVTSFGCPDILRVPIVGIGYVETRKQTNNSRFSI